MKYAVADAEVDFERNRLRRGDAEVEIEPRVADVLRYLAQRPGQVVGREELIEAVWKTANISDDVLSRCAALIRKLFEDNAREPRVLETITKRGYRLIADVRPLDEAAGWSAPPARFETALWSVSLRLLLNEAAGARDAAAAAAAAALGPGRRFSVEAAGNDLAIELRRIDPGLLAPVVGVMLGFLLAAFSVYGTGIMYSTALAAALAAVLVGAWLGFAVRRARVAHLERRLRLDLEAVLLAARLSRVRRQDGLPNPP